MGVARARLIMSKLRRRSFDTDAETLNLTESATLSLEPRAAQAN